MDVLLGVIAGIAAFAVLAGGTLLRDYWALRHTHGPNRIDDFYIPTVGLTLSGAAICLVVALATATPLVAVAGPLACLAVLALVVLAGELW